MGTALEVTSFIVQVVHDIVRDAISEVIGSVMSYIVELVCTAGLALPVVLEQISTRVASLMGSVGRNVDNLVKSARNLVSKLGELRTLFQKLGNKLDEFFTGSRADLPRTDTPDGGPSTPRSPEPEVTPDKPKDPDPTHNTPEGDTPTTKPDGTTADGTPSAKHEGTTTADGTVNGTTASGDKLPPDGTSVTPGSQARQYDPNDPVHTTVPVKDSPNKYTQADVQRTLDEAPRNAQGQPVDHRNGRPLRLTDAKGNRGWYMKYDPETKSWVAENAGLHDTNLPAKGEPGSFGYDQNGDLLPYANHRPDYGPTQVEDVWTNSRKDQLDKIRDGELKLPEPGPDEMWVQVKDNATVTDDIVETSNGKWRKIEWHPGEPRNGLWDMGHKPGSEYDTLREQYLSGEMSTEEFIEKYRNSKNYEVQDPGRNRSHVDEKRDG